MEATIRERIIAKCSDCGEEFIIFPAEQKYFEEKNLELPKRCPACRHRRRKTKTIVCVDCGKDFTLSNIDVEYYKKKGFELPKRCESCREDKRLRFDLEKELEEKELEVEKNEKPKKNSKRKKTTESFDFE